MVRAFNRAGVTARADAYDFCGGQEVVSGPAVAGVTRSPRSARSRTPETPASRRTLSGAPFVSRSEERRLLDRFILLEEHHMGRVD